jgi:DNA-binding CsgD family transcriptional regulator
VSVRAQALIEEGLDLCRTLADRRGIAFMLFGLGYIQLSQNRYAAAQTALKESLGLLRPLDDQRSLSMCLNGLAEVALHGRDSKTARVFGEEAIHTLSEVGDTWFLAFSLDGLAAVVGAERQAVLAARLFGAAEALRESIQAPLPPVRQGQYRRQVAAIKERLGEPAFAAAWASGRGITLEQIIGALAAAPPATAAASMHTGPDNLTAREVEVLRQLAAGLTSAQIAAKLIISPTTVNTHLRSIYSKLNLSSRSAATRYAIEHHLV